MVINRKNNVLIYNLVRLRLNGYVLSTQKLRQATSDSLRTFLLKLFLFPQKKMAKPDEALAKTGGGDGSRTHVRIMVNGKRYMLSLRIYVCNTSETVHVTYGSYGDTAPSYQAAQPHSVVPSFIIRINQTDRHV